jgi:DNA polymerase-3 subunit gamma/tau
MTDTPAYQVLARKYRPQTFADLIGQEAMVRTLRNAFAADRIAHAFILTGVRGVGKTTTARIVAKGLNCIGPDGSGGPTTDPCGTCEPCRAIAEGRHVDVLEMDAASRTGVNDIREIIDGVRYRAASARFKVYIIDEVHMLSTAAFNALLKTLEEPPAHVKFLFATTEIRKVPVTVLSRCQRFDLRRVEPEVMVAHLAAVAAREGVAIAPDALALLTRAAEGSVRDAMSLLDQAIAHGGGQVAAAEVRAMLGLADRGRTLDLFEAVMRGDARSALDGLAAQHADGADPLAVLRDLAEITHWVSVLKVAADAADDPTIAPDERDRGRALAGRLPMRALSRTWQMLLKAIEEVGQAPSAMMAAEMAVIRMTHVADLPDPESLIRRLQGGARPAADAAPAAPAVPAPAPPPLRGERAAGGPAAGGAAVALALDPPALAAFPSFEHVLELIRANRDAKLLFDVETGLRLVRYAPGRIEFEPAPGAPAELAARLAHRLQGWTGLRWGVSVVAAGGAPTIAEARAEAALAACAEVAALPLVQEILAAFPGARIDAVRDPDPGPPAAGQAAGEAADEVAGDWDPFADD